MLSQRTRRNGAALLVILSLLLGGCTVVQNQNSAQTGPQAVTPTRAAQGQAAAVAVTPGASQTAASATAGQESPGATTGPTSSAPLGDQQIGSGGVARAQTIPTQIPGEASALSEYERLINNVYERDGSAVVNLTDGQVTGSGFVIDKEGNILTNNHVAGEMQEIQITFADQSFATGKLVGTFPNGDIAVVKADRLPANLQPVELGDSGNLKVGQITVAMGSPLGLQQTVTSGIVSALNRSINDIDPTADPNSSLQGLIQTDASINPGNSGGPLFDSRGRVIGMNTLIATQNQGNVGLGFAIPVNRLKRVARQLIQNGQYQRPIIGASVVPVIPQIARQLQLPTTSGVMIGSLQSGGPAEKAGLRGANRTVQLRAGGSTVQYPVDGDIITAINGTPVRTLGDLRNILETQADAGDTVTITFLRDGREQQTQLTLGAAPAQ